MSILFNIWKEWVQEVKKYGTYDDDNGLTINTIPELNVLISQCRNEFQGFNLLEFRNEINNITAVKDLENKKQTLKLFHMVLYIFLIKDLTENATTGNTALNLILKAFESIPNVTTQQGKS